MKLIYLDTETTGNTKEDTLCQLGYIVEENRQESARFNELFNPGKKIPPEASAVTHITNKMVADKPLFKESPLYPETKKLLESSSSLIIAHNAAFDVRILANDNMIVPEYICTLKVARYLDKENIIPRYNLQYLRYYLDMEVDAPAHDAFGDVLVLRLLFERLYTGIAKEMNITIENETARNEHILEEMKAISKRPSLFASIPFGKYAGKTIADILSLDKGYLQWLLKQKMEAENKEEEEDWIYTLNYYLGK
jgi:DNA polymerase III epsilon subunit-like protein